MTKTIPIIEARNQLTRLPEQFEKEPHTSAIAVTRRGRPVLALMPWELYESIVETLEILGDEELMKQLRQGIRDAAAGRTIPWEKVKKDLKL